MGSWVPYPKHGGRPGFMPPRLDWNGLDPDEKEEDYDEEG